MADIEKRERRRLAAQKWRRDHKKEAQESTRQSVAKWKTGHKEQVRAMNLCWQNTNREKVRAGNKKWAAENRDKRRFAARRLRSENLEKERKRCREYAARKRATDLSFRLAGNLRRRVNEVLRGRSKSASTLILLGCAIEQAIVHIENQFQPGMTWGNYGKGGWEIDHIAPCASFNLADPAQQRTCFHFTNLQPLWALDNILKGAKLLAK